MYYQEEKKIESHPGQDAIRYAAIRSQETEETWIVYADKQAWYVRPESLPAPENATVMGRYKKGNRLD